VGSRLSKGFIPSGDEFYVDQLRGLVYKFSGWSTPWLTKGFIPSGNELGVVQLGGLVYKLAGGQHRG
jgi:hypothetical protein